MIFTLKQIKQDLTWLFISYRLKIGKININKEKLPRKIQLFNDFSTIIQTFD